MSHQKTEVRRKKRGPNIVLLGSVDSGKSTLAGHLIYKSGGFDERMLSKYEREAGELGKASFKFAWVMDSLKAERERGLTIDYHMWRLRTKKYEIGLIDVPGHRHFQKNALTGISLADVGILVVAASLGEFEYGMSSLYGMTKEHCLGAFILGLKQLIVVVNKMDESSVSFGEARFDEISSVIMKVLKSTGYNPQKVPVIPVSAWLGDNLWEPTRYMSWWKKGKSKWGGMTLLQLIDRLKCPKRPTHLPLRIPITDSFKISGIGTVLKGRVETGTVSVGQMIKVSPIEKVVKVMSIERFHTPVQKAVAGDIIGIGTFERNSFNNIYYRDVRRGFVVGDVHNDPPLPIEKMEVKMIVTGHPGRIRVGYNPMVDVRTNHVRCRIDEIREKFEKHSGKSLVYRHSEGLKKGDGAIVIMKPYNTNKKIVTDPFHRSSRMGRIVMRDSRRIVAVGMIQRVFKKGKGWVGFVSGKLFDEDEKERREYILENDVIDEWKRDCIKFDFFQGNSFLVWRSLLVV